VLRHVLRCLSKYHGPRHTTGLERLGFYGDTWTALRAGLWAALRAGLRTTPQVLPQDHATRRAAGPRYAPRHRTALRTGQPGCATRRAAGRASRRTNYSVTAPLDLRTNERRMPIHTNGHRGPVPLESAAGFMHRTRSLGPGGRPAARGGGEKPGNERLVRIINTQRMPRRVDLYCSPSPVLLTRRPAPGGRVVVGPVARRRSGPRPPAASPAHSRLLLRVTRAPAAAAKSILLQVAAGPWSSLIVPRPGYVICGRSAGVPAVPSLQHDDMARRPVYPSRSILRPDCSPKFLLLHMSQQ
jgi:hypothetical protein